MPESKVRKKQKPLTQHATKRAQKRSRKKIQGIRNLIQQLDELVPNEESIPQNDSPH